MFSDLLMIYAGRSTVTLGEQIHAVLVHADSFTSGVLGQGAMQTLRNAELELTGVVLQIIRLMDCNSIF